MNQTCVKHKLPITQMCVFIGCKKQRLMCYKCNTDHRLHLDNIVEIDNITDKMSKEYQDILTSSQYSNKNNKRGVSSYNSSCDINGSPFIYNNLANLSLGSNSPSKVDQNLKKGSIKNDACNVSQFKSNGDNTNMIAENSIEIFQLGRNEVDYQQGQDEQNCQKEREYNIIMKEEQIDDEEFLNSKTDSNPAHPEQLIKNKSNMMESKYSKDSVFTRILGNECVSQPCKLPPNSQKLSLHSSQAATTTPNTQANNYNIVGQPNSKLNALQSPPLHHPHIPFEGPFQFGNHFQQNHQLMFQQGYPPNNIPPNYSQMFGQQNHFNPQPLIPPPHGFIPYPPVHHLLLSPQLNNVRGGERELQLLKQQQVSGNGEQKDKSLSDKTYRNASQKEIENIQQMNEKINAQQVEQKENFGMPPQKQFENEIFYEVIKQNENIQKICLFLRSLNDIKMTMCAKIDRIKSTFLQSIQMKEEDFSYAFLADSFSKGNSMVEERLKNYFSKIQHLNQFFEKNQVLYNPSATNRQKQFQLEQELERILSFSIEKIDPEKVKEAKKQQQSTADPFKSNPQYDELTSCYTNSPAKIDQVKDKINFYTQYQLEFDGTSKGNPGRSGSGFLIRDTSTDNVILEYSVDTGIKTSNQAEYLALIYGMYTCFKLGIRQIRVQGDSEVVIKHMLGVYQCRSIQLKEYYNLAKVLDELFHSKEYAHVKRELNADADALANAALI